MRGERSRVAQRPAGVGPLKENPPRCEDPLRHYCVTEHPTCGAKPMRRSANHGHACANHPMGAKFWCQHPVGNFIVDFISLQAAKSTAASTTATPIVWPMRNALNILKSVNTRLSAFGTMRC